MTILNGIIFGRCPRCHNGLIFRSVWRMNADCPSCTLQFEREYGYFLMSIFIAYLIDLVIMLPAGIWLFRQRYPVFNSVLMLLLILVVITPLSFRYSRIIWLHIDHLLDPGVKKNNVKR